MILIIKKLVISTVEKLSLFIKSVLFYTGYYHYLLTKKTRNGVGLLVLAYHSVTTGRVKYAGLDVSSAHFDKQIKFIKRYFDVVDITDGIDLLNSNDRYKNKVIVTFDDGYRDNYSTAFPILRKHDIPAAIFLTTDPIIEHGLLWGHELDLMISITNSTNLVIEDIGIVDLSSEEMKKRATRLIKKYVKGLCSKEKKKVLDDIYEQIDLTSEVNVKSRYEMLLIEEIQDMACNGVTFGSHTCSHPIVSKISERELLEELIKSKSKINEWTGKDVRYFAYPNGKSDDFTEDSKIILKEANYIAAFTLLRGTNSSQTDRYELKRLPIKDSTLPEFASFILKYI